MKNGYHPAYIEKYIQVEETHDKPKESNKKPLYYGLPYIKESRKVISTGINKINRLLNNTKIIAYMYFKTENFFKNKDKLNTDVSSSLVYEFNCEQCQACYIRETRRHLQTRIKEHIRGYNPPSEIAKHQHIASPSNFKILKRTNKTKIAETLYLKKRKGNEHLINNFDASEPLVLFN